MLWERISSIAANNISMLILRFLRGVAAFVSFEERMSTYLALYQIYAMACATARFGKTYGASLYPAGRRCCAIRQCPALRISSCLFTANGSLNTLLQPALLSRPLLRLLHRLRQFHPYPRFIRQEHAHDAQRCSAARFGHSDLSVL